MVTHGKPWDGEQYVEDVLLSRNWGKRTGAHVTPMPGFEEFLRNFLARLDFEEGSGNV